MGGSGQRARELRGRLCGSLLVLLSTKLVGSWGQGIDCNPETIAAPQADGSSTNLVEVPLTANDYIEIIYSFPNRDYVTGTVAAPPGFDIEFSSNGGDTWMVNEPPSVDKVKVTGTVPAEGAGLVLDVPPPVAGAISGGNGGGDGFEPLILGRRVFNVWHHTHSKLVCTEMIKNAGVDETQTCEGYGTKSSPGYIVKVDGHVPYTSSANVGYVDSVNNRIIYPGRVGGKTGFVCVETPPGAAPSMCKASGTEAFSKDGFVKVADIGEPLGWGYPDYAQQKLFGIPWGHVKVYCVDLSDPADIKPCAGFPYEDHGLLLWRVSVMPKSTRVILVSRDTAACMDSSTNPPSKCQGWPDKVSTGYNEAPPIAIPDERGIALGFCKYAAVSSVRCFHLSDGSEAKGDTELGKAGAKFQALTGARNVPMMCHYAHLPFFKTRTYFAMGAFDSTQGWVCYDGKTKDICENFPKSAPVPSGTYGLAIDPMGNGACLWALGDRGVLRSFSAADPAESCGSAQPSVTVAIPERDDTKLVSVQLLHTTGADYDGVTVKVMDKKGTVLKVADLAAGKVSLADIPAQGDNTELTFELDLGDLSKMAKDLFEESASRPQLPALEVVWEGAPAVSSIQGATQIGIEAHAGDTQSLCITSTVTATSTTITATSTTATTTRTTTTTTMTTLEAMSDSEESMPDSEAEAMSDSEESMPESEAEAMAFGKKGAFDSFQNKVQQVPSTLHHGFDLLGGTSPVTMLIVLAGVAVAGGLVVRLPVASMRRTFARWRSRGSQGVMMLADGDSED